MKQNLKAGRGIPGKRGGGRLHKYEYPKPNPILKSSVHSSQDGLLNLGKNRGRDGDDRRILYFKKIREKGKRRTGEDQHALREGGGEKSPTRGTERAGGGGSLL